MIETTTELIVPGTGEVIDLASATDADVVDYIEQANAAREQIDAFKARASTELIERMDRSGEWTRRVKVGETTYEIKAPSPTAGTESYDEEALIEAVKRLRREGVIDASAVGKTVRHIVTVEFVTGSEVEANKITEQAKADVRATEVKHETKIAKTGINALSKIPGAAEAVEACKRVSEPKSAAERRATVKAKGA